MVDISHDEARFWTFGKTAQMRFERIRCQSIVSVKKDHTVTHARTETGVARCRESLVLLLHTFHRRVTPNYLENVIGRTIVDHDNFCLAVGLR